MMMTHHYVRAARIIADITDATIRHFVAAHFADMFQWDDPNFVREWFLRLCGAEEPIGSHLVFAEEG